MALKIDILAMEMARKLPHWLSWAAKNAERVKAIRLKHRRRWLARQAAARKDREQSSVSQTGDTNDR